MTGDVLEYMGMEESEEISSTDCAKRKEALNSQPRPSVTWISSVIGFKEILF